MNRIPLTDGSGRWFDNEKAVEFSESTWWNGHNRISKETNSQWHHVDLYRTKGGLWVQCTYSDYRDTPTTYEEIDEDEAVRFLVEHDHVGSDDYNALPEAIRAQVDEKVAALEM